MPTYEYECGYCAHRFEVRQGFHDKPQAKCPQCQKKAKRVFHPSLIIFKGSGFYVTDHRKIGDSSTSKSTPESSKPKTETKKSTEPPASKGDSDAGKAKSETKKSSE